MLAFTSTLASVKEQPNASNRQGQQNPCCACKTMRESGYWERRDVQEMICRSPRSFCEELGEDIYIVGSEAQPSAFVQDRIDLLGVDPDCEVLPTGISGRALK